MKESEIETYFVWAVELAGGQTWKAKCIGRRGFPDRVAVLTDKSIWLVELKAPRGRLSALQKQFAASVKGANYTVLWNKEQVDEWIKVRQRL